MRIGGGSISPQRRSGSTSASPLSSHQIMSYIVIVLIVVQLTTISLSFHSSASSQISCTSRIDDSRMSNRRVPRNETMVTPPTPMSVPYPTSIVRNTNSSGSTTSTSASTNRRKQGGKIPDGSFNGYPLYLRSGHSIHSSVHCVGENYRQDAWIHRSCKFRHFCFDTAKGEFVIYQSKEESQLKMALTNRSFHHSSNQMNGDVAIGGINTKWTWSQGVPRLRWSPRVVEGVLEEDYYELDDDVVLVPFHSFFAQNPGTEDDGVIHSLLWLDFFCVGNCTCETLTHAVYHMHTDTSRSSSVG